MYENTNDGLFLENYKKILEYDKWIIEGNALDWIDDRLEKADILIFFESDIKTSINNFILREEKINKSEELRKSFDERITQPLEKTIEWIKNRYSKKIEKIRIKLKNYEKKLIVIANYEELNKIINELNKE